MDCKSANILMMKYMDQILTESEARSLSSHIVKCASCKEDFLIYEDIALEFEKDSLCLFEPPENFEVCVMEVISGINPEYGRVFSQDSVICFVFGTFSMLFGTGVILSMYQREIMAAASSYPYIGRIMEGAVDASQYAAAFAAEASYRLLLYLDMASALIDTVKYVILAVVAALIAVQYVIYMKNKVEA